MGCLELKVAILKKFPTQSDFATAVGESESKISRIVRGRRKLTCEETEKWSKVLKCNVLQRVNSN